jgi:hypothetical protein
MAYANTREDILKNFDVNKDGNRDSRIRREPARAGLEALYARPGRRRRNG